MGIMAGSGQHGDRSEKPSAHISTINMKPREQTRSSAWLLISNSAPSDIHPPVRLYLPRQRHLLGTKCLNAPDYEVVSHSNHSHESMEMCYQHSHCKLMPKFWLVAMFFFKSFFLFILFILLSYVTSFRTVSIIILVVETKSCCVIQAVLELLVLSPSESWDKDACQHIWLLSILSDDNLVAMVLLDLAFFSFSHFRGWGWRILQSPDPNALTSPAFPLLTLKQSPCVTSTAEENTHFPTIAQVWIIITSLGPCIFITYIIHIDHVPSYTQIFFIPLPVSSLSSPRQFYIII